MFATSVQSAPARIALVIGNSDYENAPLKNPVNDAALMASTLKGVGFEVMAHVNLDRREMKRAFLSFQRRIKEAGSDTVSLVYYSGHGAQVNGENYLIPVGSLIADEYDVDIEGVRASSLLKTLDDANAALNIVILDACRNNPFQSSSRSAHRGLAKMDAPTGTLLAYSTAPGQVAEDGSGSNSAYTIALSLAIRMPGAKVEEVFKRVRIEVMTRTLDQQVPWESSSLTGDFYFSGNTTTTQAPVAAAPATLAAPVVDKETIFWQSIQDSEDAGDFKAYLQQYPDGSFAALARFKVKKYQETAVASQRSIENKCREGLIAALASHTWTLKTYFKDGVNSWNMDFERNGGGVQAKSKRRTHAVEITKCDEIVFQWKPNEKKAYRLKQDGKKFVGFRVKRGHEDYRAEMSP